MRIMRTESEIRKCFMNIIRSKDGIVYPELSYRITGLLFRARKTLGVFANERQYCDMIETLLKDDGFAYEREKLLPSSFEGEARGRNRIDFLVEGKIVLEVKTKSFLTKDDYYQTRRYLHALKKKLGILVNMRRYYIHPKRILNSQVSDG